MISPFCINCRLISTHLSDYLAEFQLLSLLRTKDSVSNLDIETIRVGFPKSLGSLRQVLLQPAEGEGYRKSEEWDRFKLSGEFPYDLLNRLTKEAGYSMETWWLEKPVVSSNEPVPPVKTHDSKPRNPKKAEIGTGIRTSTVPETKIITTSVSVLLGVDENQKQVFWKPFGEVNPHLLICGFSGTGKTQSLRTIVNEPDRLGIPSIIFDFKGGTFNVGNKVDINKVTVNPLELDFKKGQDIAKAWGPKDKSLNVSQAFDKIFGFGRNSTKSEACRCIS